MRILVTGGMGVVGSALVEQLRSKGHHVVYCDLYHNHDEVGFSLRTDVPDALYVRCDVGEYRQLQRLFDAMGPFDCVYHCAAEFGRWNGEDFYENMWKSNAIGTKTRHSAAREAQIPPDPFLLLRSLRRLAGPDDRVRHG